MWILHAVDLKTGEMKEYLEGDLGWQDLLSNAKHVIGHNVIGFDLQALKKLFDFDLKSDCQITDTMILSLVLNYRRFGDDGHSLEAWGKFLKQPKQEHEDWTQFSEEMRTRCRSDVQLNIKVYEIVRKELVALSTKAPQIIHYLDAEHYTAEWCAQAEREGWPFDMEKASILQPKLEASVQLAYEALSAKLGTKTVAIDKKNGEVLPKKPKWTKDGFYDAHTCRWFDIEPPSGFEGEERMVLGPYSRIKFEPLSLDSVTDVKIFLNRNGWKPTQWNYKTEFDDETGRYKRIKTSPKITEDSLEFLGGDGKLYSDFAVARSRLSILKTWIEAAKKDGKVHGGAFPIGTPSFRARHSIIVNVTSVDSAWGKEMRELFTCKPGWRLVGCDSSGNQARGLAHYLKDAAYIDTLLHGDVHRVNARILDSVLLGMGIAWDEWLVEQGMTADEKHTLEENILARQRSNAKRILYAFLFGASGEKLWSYVFGVFNKRKGSELKTGFMKAVPGFEALITKLNDIFNKTKRTGDGYIPSITGARIYVDSPHKLLVYLLQATEKATCAAALMLTVKELRKRNIPYTPCIFMHDEIQFQVPEEYAEEVGKIGKLAFKEGPKLFNIQIMDGEYKIGNNWFETH
jgi:DNA polymerase I-like protein with 3'-5' exonuclease and polymerase domains